MPYKFNESRRHKIPKARYRVTNWPEYDAALVRRGSLTVWLTEEAVSAWHAPATGSPSQTGGKVVACRFPERWVAAADDLIEIAVEDACSGLKQQMSVPMGPPHRLTLVKAFGRW